MRLLVMGIWNMVVLTTLAVIGWAVWQVWPLVVFAAWGGGG